MKGLLFLMFIILISSCSSSKILTIATQGTLSEENFTSEIPFYYEGKYMYVDITISQKSILFYLILDGTNTLLKEKYTVDESKKRKFEIQELLIDSKEYFGHELQIESNISSLMGNDFLDEFIVTIDWKKNILYLE